MFYDLDVDGNTSLTGRKEMRLKGVGCNFGSDFVRLFLYIAVLVKLVL